MKAENVFDEDWKYVSSFLPARWTVKAKELKAFVRHRGIKSARILLRVLMMHIAEGLSLRDTVVEAASGKLCNISDVALNKRLANSGEWLRWLCQELLARRQIDLKRPHWLKGRVVKSIDGSSVSEPGSRGTDWRLHYSLNMYDLSCDQVLVTSPKQGESFSNFTINKGDVYIGDRAYGRLKGMIHVTSQGGDFITRLKKDAFPIKKDEKKIDLIKNCSSLKYGDIGDWDVVGFSAASLQQPMRICVMKKSKQQAAKDIKALKRNASKKCIKLTKESIEYCKYFIVATSLPADVDALKILELYRQRWQVEIAFKRLKSLLGTGALPKKDDQTSKAWLYGKIFLSLLVEEMINEGRLFSPWGYRNRK